MLTDIQQKLLQMMKEIDKICLDKDIHYSLGGGTAIGAIRHKGFIPWDDDIDIYMTRDNWEKFKLAEKEGSFPPFRKLESAETDIEYANTFGRYVTTDSTAIHSNQIIANDAGGHVIDIFVFDPVHIDNFWKFMEDYQLYSDLMNETMGYSTRFDMNIKRYPVAYRRTQTEGKKVVIDELINSFTHQDAPGWDHYIMEWGTAPFLFPASIFRGGYERLAFEDTTLEIVRNYSEYLVWQYGDEWQYIPKHEGREGHDAIFSNNLPYQLVREDYLPFIDKKKLHKAYIRRKYRLMLANQHRRTAQIAGLKDAGDKCVAELMNRLKEKGLSSKDLKRMLKEYRYSELSDIFADYYEKQLSADFIGRHDKHSTLHRYYNPVLINVEEAVFEVAVETLIRTERMSKARRLIELFEGYAGELEIRKGTRNNPSIESLKNEIDRARVLINEYSHSRNADIYKKICDYVKAYPDNSQISRLKARMLIENPSLDNNGAEIATAIIDDLINTYGETSVFYGELRKYQEDIKSSTDGLGIEAVEEYKKIHELTNNGFIKLEIEELLSSMGYAIEREEDETTSVIVDRKGGVYSRKNSIYRIASNAFKKIAAADDRTKAHAWEIACRTRDRIVLLDLYENRIEELLSLRANDEWDRIAHIMEPHQEAVMRNLDAGLGLCVHPVLNDLQKQLFIRQGNSKIINRIESLIPEEHRKPIRKITGQ